MKWEKELGLAEIAVREAGALLLAAFAKDAGIQSREGKDIKTRADVEAESLIVRHLEQSRIPILGEEAAKAGAESPALRWLVDPLDGTMNFTRGFPMHAVSVGLWDGMQPILGAVFDLSRKELFTGCVGAGASCEGRAMRVSGTNERGQAILATGFPTGRDFGVNALTAFVQRIQQFKKIRMIGSAALSLAMVADGVFDAYFEEDIMIWDVAAGLALVSAAGGKIEVQAGQRPHSLVVAASNGKITI